MIESDRLQRWAAIATILALVLALAALLRDVFDINVVKGSDDPTAASSPAPPTATAYATAAVDATAPPTATATPQPRNLTGGATATASSELTAQYFELFGLVSYAPANALDGDPATSWVEGVGGHGIGETLELRFARPVRITRVGLDVGFDRDSEIFAKNNRVRRARLIFDNGNKASASFRDHGGVQYQELDPIDTASVIIEIEDVYIGSVFDDTPIAEVEIWGYEQP